MPKTERTNYERMPKQLSPNAWYYHTLGKVLEVEIDIEGPQHHISVRIPLKRILKAEARCAKG